MKRALGITILVTLSVASVAQAEPWVEDKAFFTEPVQLGSSMVDAADLDGDGWIDLVFANGEGYDKGTADSDQLQQAYHNDAGMSMVPIGADIFQGVSYAGRAVKVRDIDNDGDNDIVLGTTWQTQSQIFINSGSGTFTNETASHLPQIKASVGDLEFGDVDDDGDLDMILADWGSDSPVSDINSSGGVTQLWTQDGKAGYGGMGTAMFFDETLGKMPNTSLRWSWDIEFVDLDNDYDLDAVASCFACSKASVYLFANDGTGKFSDIPLANVPQGLAALSVEAMDLNGDSFLDLVTLHDGVGGRNRVLIADKQGAFEDKSSQVWPMLENPSSYDMMAAFLDYNSTSGPDLILGAQQPGDNKYPDRLMENQNGKFKANNFAFAEIKPSPGTYAIILADFNLDRILDVAMSQKENASEKKVFIGSNVDLQPDSAAPVFVNHQSLGADIKFGATHTLRMRVHDNKSPLMLHDFQSGDGKPDGRPYVESWNSHPGDPGMNPGTASDPGQWYGEYLWRVTFDVPMDIEIFFYRKCAIDAAGNKYCTDLEHVDNPNFDEPTGSATATGENTTQPTSGTGGDSMSLSTLSTDDESDGADTVTPTAGTTPTDTSTSSTNTVGDEPIDDGGCFCNGAQRSPGWLLPLVWAIGMRRRRNDDSNHTKAPGV